MAKPRYLPSGVLSKHAAKRVLGPYQGLLVRVVLHGWNGWEKFGQSAPDVRVETGNLTRADLVSDLMSREAKRLFRPIRGVDVSEPYGRVALAFAQGDLRLTFHKIDPGFIQNPRSDRQYELWSQADATTDGRLPGMGSGTWARVGYVLDRTKTRIRGIVVRCTTDGVVDWLLELPMPATGAAPVPVVVDGGPPPSKITSARKAAPAQTADPSP